MVCSLGGLNDNVRQTLMQKGGYTDCTVCTSIPAESKRY